MCLHLFPPIWRIPLAVTHRSSSQGGRASGPCRYELGSSWIPLGCGCSQSGCWEIWVWHRPQHHVDGGFQKPGRPSYTWEDRGPCLSDPDQQRQTCQCQGRGGQEDRVVQGFRGDPYRRTRCKGYIWHNMVFWHFLCPVIPLFVISNFLLTNGGLFFLLPPHLPQWGQEMLPSVLQSVRLNLVYFCMASLITRYKNPSDANWNPCCNLICDHFDL